MKHYGATQWIDLARGLAVDDSTAMQNHLSAGCEDCSQASQFYQKLARFGREMALVAVPESVVQEARSIFKRLRPERPKRAFRVPVELIYDSFLAPAPVGLRATWQVGWQGLFRAGDCSLDIRVEPELRSSRAALIGQISNYLVPAANMGDLPVYLKAGRTIVAQTSSNRFGEFQVEYEQQKRLHLCIYLEGGTKYVQVPLKRLGSEKYTDERLKLGIGQGKKRFPNKN